MGGAIPKHKFWETLAAEKAGRVDKTSTKKKTQKVRPMCDDSEVLNILNAGGRYQYRFYIEVF